MLRNLPVQFVGIQASSVIPIIYWSTYSLLQYANTPISWCIAYPVCYSSPHTWQSDKDLRSQPDSQSTCPQVKVLYESEIRPSGPEVGEINCDIFYGKQSTKCFALGYIILAILASRCAVVFEGRSRAGNNREDLGSCILAS